MTTNVTKSETKRAFTEDRAICDAATSGEWRWVPGNSKYRDHGTIRSDTEGDVCDFGNYAQYYPIAGNEPDETDITFITEARTGWPAALDRIAELEAENIRLAIDNAGLRAENEALRISMRSLNKTEVTEFDDEDNTKKGGF